MLKQMIVIYCVSALMTEKTIGAYRQVFQIIKRKIRDDYEINWQPIYAISDFEQPLIAAMETEFLRARLCGCYFHFSQSLWRRIQELGISNPYRENRLLKRNLRKVMSIGYLPIQLLRMNFNRLMLSRETRELINQYPALQEFYNYFRNNYLNGNFLPEFWNVYNRNMPIFYFHFDLDFVFNSISIHM